MDEAHTERAGDWPRRRSMTERQMAMAQRHIAALSALKVYPGHLPLDSQCLDDLVQMGLVRPAKDGYRLTPRGEESLEAAVNLLRSQRVLS